MEYSLESSRSSMDIDNPTGKEKTTSDEENVEDDTITIRKNLESRTYDAIHKHAQIIRDTMERYSNPPKKKERKDEDRNPMKGCHLVEQKTSDMVDVWSEYYTQMKDIQNKSINFDADNRIFRKVYMGMITEAFADELDDLRHGRVKDKSNKKKKKSNEYNEVLEQQNVVVPKVKETVETLKSNDIKVLISCLESGMNIWTDEEKGFLTTKRREDQRNSNQKKDPVTIHEKRRIALFGE